MLTFVKLLTWFYDFGNGNNEHGLNKIHSCGIGSPLPIIGLTHLPYIGEAFCVALPMWGRNLVMVFEMSQQFDLYPQGVEYSSLK